MRANGLQIGTGALAAAAAMLALPGMALAQHATSNAVNESDDAFGTNIGFESTGIYTEFDTRGFSPTKAGNVRIDGIYFDPVAITAGRLRDRTAIRVGFGPESPEVQEIVAKHYEWVSLFWTPTAETYTGLTQMYVDDERFRRNYDEVAPGAAALLRDAAAIFAERELA